MTGDCAQAMLLRTVRRRKRNTIVRSIFSTLTSKSEPAISLNCCNVRDRIVRASPAHNLHHSSPQPSCGGMRLRCRSDEFQHLKQKNLFTSGDTKRLAGTWLMGELGGIEGESSKDERARLGPM